jgi:hypothetical protein
MRGVILVAFHPTHQRGKRKIPNPAFSVFPPQVTQKENATQLNIGGGKKFVLPLLAVKSSMATDA